MIVAEMDQRLNEEILPQWEQELGEPLTDKLKQVVRLLHVIAIQTHIPPPPRQRGPKGHDRGLLARAFVVKALYNAPTTRALLEMLPTQPMLRRLIGWQHRQDIPSEPTFSRAFAAFAALNLGAVVHQALVATYIGNRLVGHICRDSTEIEAREKAVKKPKKPARPKRKPGRPKKAEEPPPEPTRLQKQVG